MPTFEFTSPEGDIYEIDGPEGSTVEQAWPILQGEIAAGRITAAKKGVLDSLVSGVKDWGSRLSGAEFTATPQRDAPTGPMSEQDLILGRGEGPRATIPMTSPELDSQAVMQELLKTKDPFAIGPQAIGIPETPPGVVEYFQRGTEAAGRAAENAPWLAAGGDSAAVTANILQELQAPVSPGMQAFGEAARGIDEAEGFGPTAAAIGELLKSVGQHPKDMLGLAIESAGSSLPIMAGSAAGMAAAPVVPAGPLALPATMASKAVGAFAGGVAPAVMIEANAILTESVAKRLQAAGLQPSTETIQALLDDPGFREEVRQEGILKGVGTQGIDSALMTVAGTLATRPMRLAESAALRAGFKPEEVAFALAAPAMKDVLPGVASRVGHGAAGTATDIVGEGLSEYGGKALATGEGSLGEAMLETLAGAPTSVADTAIAAGLMGTDKVKEAVAGATEPRGPEILEPALRALADEQARKGMEPAQPEAKPEAKPTPQVTAKQPAAEGPYAQPMQAQADTAGPADIADTIEPKKAQAPEVDYPQVIPIPAPPKENPEARRVRQHKEGLPVDAQGNVHLVHYSKQPGLTELDPSFYGKGIRGAEAKRKMENPQTWADRTHFGVKGYYTKETALGKEQYETVIPAAQIYDMQADPMNLKEQARLDSGALDFTLYEQKIRDAGFQAAWVQQGDNKVVVKFDKTPVTAAALPGQPTAPAPTPTRPPEPPAAATPAVPDARTPMVEAKQARDDMVLELRRRVADMQLAAEYSDDINARQRERTEYQRIARIADDLESGAITLGEAVKLIARKTEAPAPKPAPKAKAAITQPHPLGPMSPVVQKGYSGVPGMPMFTQVNVAPTKHVAAIVTHNPPGAVTQHADKVFRGRLGGRLLRAELAQTISSLEARGMPVGYILQHIKGIYVIHGQNKTSGSHARLDPEYFDGNGSMIGIRSDHLQNKGNAEGEHQLAFMMAHEMGHSVDKGPRTKATRTVPYRSVQSPLFALDGTGAVMNELIAAWQEDRGDLRHTLHYPFHNKTVGLEAHQLYQEIGGSYAKKAATQSGPFLRQEAFAQLWALFYTHGADPVARESLREAIPESIKFMEELHDAITNGSSEVGEVERRISAAFRIDAAAELRGEAVQPGTAAEEVRGGAGERATGPGPGSDQDGGVPGGRELLDERVPYGTAPDTLMGFKKSGPQTPYAESNYKKEITVRVSYPNQEPFEDGIRGLNTPHALERARRNWPDAKIELVSETPYTEVEGITVPGQIVPGGATISIETHLENFAKLRAFFNSASDVLRRQPALVPLADAVDKRFDLSSKLLGEQADVMRRAEEPFTGVGNAAKREEAHRVFREYFGHQENGRAAAAATTYQAATTEQRALIDAWQQVASDTGDKLLDIGQKVYDPILGKWRLLRKVDLFFPRTFKPEVMEWVNNSEKYADELLTLQQLMVDAGLVPDTHAGRASVLTKLRSEIGRVTSTEYFAGIERARTQQWPEELYDYTWDAATNYLVRWADRTAQIMALGQKGPEEDLFQKLMPHADRRTQVYLKLVSDSVYNVRPTTAHAEWLNNASTIVSGLMLGHPGAALTNLLGGTIFNVATHGVVPSLKGLFALMTDFQESVNEAKQKGVLLHDMLQLEHDRIKFGGSAKITQGVTTALTYSGFLPAETVVRTHAMLIARANLRDMIKAFNKNIESNKSRMHLVVLQRHGFDYRALVAENGVGEETDRYLRWASNTAQGSYTAAGHPAAMDTAMMRFVAKFQKWGTGAARNFTKNFLVPFSKSIAGKGETITYEVDGEEVSTRVRSFLPMIRYLGVQAAGGYFLLLPAMAMMGVGDDAPDYDELEKALEDDELAKAAELAAVAVWDALQTSSFMGVLGIPIEYVTSVYRGDRIHNPFFAPLRILEAFGNFILRIGEEKGVTAANLKEWTNATAPLTRSAERLASDLGVLGEHKQTLEVWRRDMGDLNRRKRAFARDTDLERKGRMPDRTPKGEYTTMKQDIVNALIVGNPEQAKIILEDQMAKATTFKEAESIKQAAIASVRTRAPFNVFEEASAGASIKFNRWLKKNAGAPEYARFASMQNDYTSAAEAAGLMSRKTPMDDMAAEREWDKAHKPRTQQEIKTKERLDEIKKLTKKPGVSLGPLY